MGPEPRPDLSAPSAAETPRLHRRGADPGCRPRGGGSVSGWRVPSVRRMSRPWPWMRSQVVSEPGRRPVRARLLLFDGELWTHPCALTPSLTFLGLFQLGDISPCPWCGGNDAPAQVGPEGPLRPWKNVLQKRGGVSTGPGLQEGAVPGHFSPVPRALSRAGRKLGGANTYFHQQCQLNPEHPAPFAFQVNSGYVFSSKCTPEPARELLTLTSVGGGGFGWPSWMFDAPPGASRVLAFAPEGLPFFLSGSQGDSRPQPSSSTQDEGGTWGQTHMFSCGSRSTSAPGRLASRWPHRASASIASAWTAAVPPSPVRLRRGHVGPRGVWGSSHVLDTAASLGALLREAQGST